MVKPKEQVGRKPEWLKKRLPPGGKVKAMEMLVKDHGLNTVCHGARCPNQNDCFHEGTATFLIMGDACTRRCGFCSIRKAEPQPLDPHEPERLAEAVQKMKLSYAVITSVTRDDLEDGGASRFAAVIRALKTRMPGLRVEVLIPDFQGSRTALDTVLEAEPIVLNHNIETVPSLYSKVRPGAEYERSLTLLARIASHRSNIPAKSGFMAGLGESMEEVVQTLEDLRRVGCRLLTIGQYLKPAEGCLPVKEYVPPERFQEYARVAEDLGFSGVSAGPFVRSSHKASELYSAYLKRK